VYDGKNTRAARRACPEKLWRIAGRKLDLLNAAGSLDDLQAPPGNRLEALTGDRLGQHSIRINDQYPSVLNGLQPDPQMWKSWTITEARR